jgi:signal transduction histidine kinase/uncharacterized protein YhfF
LSALATTTTDPEPAYPERDLLRAVAAGTAGVVGEAFLRSLVHHVAEAFDAEIAFVAQTIEEQPTRVRIVASWQRGAARLPEGLELEVAGTPCALAGKQDVVVFPEGACDRFPGAEMLCEHGLDGFLAIAMRGAGGVYLGHLGILSRRRVDATQDEIAALSIFAARAGAEIERRRHELALRQRDAEVAASRARMVQAADDERRRIGRDMHDGAQQRLLALGHLAGLALRRLPDGTDEACELIERVREEAVLAHTELRELARGLHPAGLTERGLAGALEALGARSDLALRIEAMPERRLPDPVAVTVYYLVSEALSNAVKYADASALRVEVAMREREVVATVSDDGTGGAQPEAGTGLLGLADRVAALGGRLVIDSPPRGGTTLAATIPLAPWRTAQEPFLEFGYEGDGGLGEHLIQLVLEGRKTVSTSLQREWELEGGPPRIGQRLPVLDGAGRRRAIVEVTQVMVVPFSIIDDDIVAAELAAGESAEDWRASQRAFYEGSREEMALLLGEPGWRITDDEPIIVTWFALVEGGE